MSLYAEILKGDMIILWVISVCLENFNLITFLNFEFLQSHV